MGPLGDDPRWAPFLDAPEHAAVLTDFDGTLAPIVDDPATARAVDGAADVLATLAQRFAVVAVISGRPVAFLQQWLPSSVVLSGLYGLETVRDGQRVDHPDGASWRGVIADVAAASRADGPSGMLVEEKGLSLTLHYRGAPTLEAQVRSWAVGQAARSGLHLRDARMSVELHPPIAADKGTALRHLTGGLRAVCFLGDDAGDLTAFDALDALEADGVATVKVAVHSDEAPAALLARADVTVDGPEAAVALLAALSEG